MFGMIIEKLFIADLQKIPVRMLVFGLITLLELRLRALIADALQLPVPFSGRLVMDLVHVLFTASFAVPLFVIVAVHDGVRRKLRSVLVDVTKLSCLCRCHFRRRLAD